jgi:hypothetical protein
MKWYITLVPYWPDFIINSGEDLWNKIKDQKELKNVNPVLY